MKSFAFIDFKGPQVRLWITWSYELFFLVQFSKHAVKASQTPEILRHERPSHVVGGPERSECVGGHHNGPS